MVRKEESEGFYKRIEEALPLSAFLLQGLQRKLAFPVHSIEGRQQLVALAQPYVQAAHGLYQFLLAEGLAELVELPTWRIEKQMDVRSGFAQVKKGGQAQKNHHQWAVSWWLRYLLKSFEFYLSPSMGRFF